MALGASWERTKTRQRHVVLHQLSARKQITGVASGAVVQLPRDRARVGGSMASRRASAAPLLPPPRQNFHFVFHGLPARVICPLSHRGEESVPSLVRRCLAACFSMHRAQFAGTRATVVLLVDASLQQNAAGRNSRPTTEPRAGDSSSTAEQSAALPAADVVPRLDRAVPALADRRRSAAAGADIKKVARVAPVSGSHLAAARGVERRVTTMRGAARPVLSRGELAARLCGISGRAE